MWPAFPDLASARLHDCRGSKMPMTRQSMPKDVFWVRRWDEGALMRYVVMGRAREWSLRAWWGLQRRELGRWAGVWARWLEEWSTR